MEPQCLIDNKNFIKTKNRFNHFLSTFAFFKFIVMYIFLSQIYFGIAQYKLEKKNSSQLNFLCYNLPYYAKTLEKYALILPWLKFKHGHP
jgi:hypothetical protein